MAYDIYEELDSIHSNFTGTDDNIAEQDAAQSACLTKFYRSMTTYDLYHLEAFGDLHRDSDTEFYAVYDQRMAQRAIVEAILL